LGGACYKDEFLAMYHWICIFGSLLVMMGYHGIVRGDLGKIIALVLMD